MHPVEEKDYKLWLEKAHECADSFLDGLSSSHIVDKICQIGHQRDACREQLQKQPKFDYESLPRIRVRKGCYMEGTLGHQLGLPVWLEGASWTPVAWDSDMLREPDWHHTDAIEVYSTETVEVWKGAVDAAQDPSAASN